MREIYKKTTKVLFLVLFLVLSFSFIFLLSSRPASAQSTTPTLNATDCNNPFSGVYTTQACVELRLGISDIKSDTIVIARDPNSVIIVAFRIFLYIIITITVGRVAWVGLKIGGLKEEVEKRQEYIMQIVWILGGMIVAVSALGLTYAAQNIFFGKSFDDQIIKCSDLPQNASQELKDKCNQNISVIPTTTTSTPKTKTCISDTNPNVTITFPADVGCPANFHE